MKERRRSARVPVAVLIQVVGIKANTSSSVAKPGKMVDANVHGALVECRTRFEPGSDVMIQNLESSQSALARVVRCRPGTDAVGWQIGVELMDSSMKDFLGGN